MVGRPEHRRAVSVWPAPAEVPAGRVVVAEPALPAPCSEPQPVTSSAAAIAADPVYRRPMRTAQRLRSGVRRP